MTLVKCSGSSTRMLRAHLHYHHPKEFPEVEASERKEQASKPDKKLDTYFNA